MKKSSVRNKKNTGPVKRRVVSVSRVDRSPAPVETEAEPYKKVTWKAGTMIYPLPAVMVSCGTGPTEHNIITIAWTGITCTDPPQCYISIRPERHSHHIIKKTREFCINLTSAELTFATDWCGVKSGREHDKFKEMKLTPLPCQFIRAPMIAQSPINLECKVTRILSLGSHDMFMAEILAIHATEKYVNPQTGALNLEKTPLVSYSHGKYYQLGAYKGKFGFSVQKKKNKRKTS